MQKTCPTCDGGGKVPSGYKSETTMRPLFSFQPGEKDGRTIQAVDIPRKHAFDFGGTAAVFGAGFVGLIGGTLPQCGITALMAGSAVFGIVRYLSTAQDNKRVVKRDKLAADIIPREAPAPAQTAPDNAGYLPVYAAPAPDRWAVLKDFVRSCEQIGTAQNYWETTHKMERKKYLELRELLIGLNWAGWVSQNAKGQGWKLLFTADQIIAGLFRGTTRDGSYAAPRPTATRMEAQE